MKVRFTEDEAAKQEVLQALKDNDGYCPCRLEKTADTKCMCKEFREQASGYCHCGLYYKDGVGNA